MFPTEFSAEEMVKVYSAIPVHMRQQSLELVSQTVDLSSPVSWRSNGKMETIL